MVLLILFKFTLACWPVTVDLLPLRSVDKGKFVWTSSYNWAVLVVKLEVVHGTVAAEIRLNGGPVCCSRDSGPGIFGQRVEIDVVDENASVVYYGL